MAERLWVLKGCKLFERVAPQQLASLENASSMRRFAKGEFVYLPTDPAEGVLLLAEGRIRIANLTPEGKQSVLAFVEPGELFGELALIEAGVREEFAEAAAASLVICVPSAAILAVMEEDPRLAFGVTKLIGFRRRRIERRLKSLLFRSTRERLMHLLLELLEDYGTSVSNGVLIGIKLSHHELASVIGSTRETVTLLLGELQLEGLLTVGRQRIIVRHPAQLAHEIGVPAPLIRGAPGAIADESPRNVVPLTKPATPSGA